jgi:hypothetical protein
LLGDKDFFFRLDPFFQGDDDPSLLERPESTPSPAGEGWGEVFFWRDPALSIAEGMTKRVVTDP